ncbi:hypothetical protein [Streptomyces microflavus]|uniref:hypothetical protein n=1 Tax=Streptomyces microflavus TaxID=1919 RepID=UPI002E30032A|nr:hypothetical protein [Streptomyces microflavus]
MTAREELRREMVHHHLYMTEERADELIDAALQEAAQQREGETPTVPAAALKLLRFMANRCVDRDINSAEYILSLVDHAIDEHNLREYVDGLDRDEIELRERVEIAEAASRELAALVARLRGTGIIDAEGKVAPFAQGMVDATVRRVRDLHRPVEHRGRTICVECSAWGNGSTDNPPTLHPCDTINALDGQER